MTRKQILKRATPDYAQSFIEKLGKEVYERELCLILVDFVKEVVQPRQNEKDSQGHH